MAETSAAETRPDDQAHVWLSYLDAATPRTSRGGLCYP
jgi:hypothetical protein